MRRAASSILRFKASPVSSVSSLVVTRPSTTRLAFRHEAQRREITRARVVVLEEVAVDRELVEQYLRDRLVAAFGDPRALEIAATQVDADGHVGRAFGDRGVDQPSVAARQFVGVVAALARAFAHPVIAKVGEVGVVELQVTAAGIGQRADFRAIGGRDVGEEHLHVGVGARG